MEQKPGWNNNILKWCLHEAQLKPQDYMGGLVLDEMKIQVLLGCQQPLFIIQFFKLNFKINIFNSCKLPFLPYNR